MIERAEIIRRNPLVPAMEASGAVMRGRGNDLLTNRCATTEHKAGHFCVAVDTGREVWFCNDCQHGGSVIDWIALADGTSPVDVLKRLGEDNTPPARQKTATEPPKRNPGTLGRLVKTYDYTDAGGKLVFQVCRYEPKDFRQRRPDGVGGWIGNLEGVTRTLYNLPKLAAADFILICEGEKDADTINAMGWVATTNCGGAEKWEPSYSAALRGKDVAILPDNDDKGKKHCEKLKAALAPVARSIRVVEMPHGFKDVTEFAESCPTRDDAMRALLEMLGTAEVLFAGESVPVQTMDELERDYEAHLKRAATHQLDLGKWIPSFRRVVRPLVPGELCTILAGTGCGKTMMLQNIAINAGMVTLMFEAELPGTLTFERFAAMATKTTGHAVETSYKEGRPVDWISTQKLQNVVCCHKAGLTPQMIQKIINTTQLKTTTRPVLVLIDYIQLIGGDGESRYERTSGVAEQLKQVAKETGTIIIMASQIARAVQPKDGKKKASPEVSLTDGKDSGSIENSSGLVIGAWRDDDDKDRLWMKILKNTKGVPGMQVPCRILPSLLIHEETTEQ